MPPTYRYEIASTGRAICQNSACKKESVKITKGELRFGSLVTLPNFGDSWKWKHWGCVTPLQISNIVDQMGGLEGLDLDNDLDILDGYDELPDWAQNKIRDALANGHVDDEDWKGDPELNRPGQKGINKRTPKKKAGDDESADGAADDSPVKPKKGGRKKKAAVSDDEDEKPATKKKAASKKRKSVGDEDEEGTEAAPSRKRAAKGKKAVVEDEDADAEETKPVQKRAARSKKATGKDETVDEAAPEPSKRKSRSRKVKQEPEVGAEAETEQPAIPQSDGTEEVEKKTSKKATNKKSGKRAAPVDEDDDQHDVTETRAPKPTKASRSKKAKTEPATEDVTVADPAPKPTKATRTKANKAAPKQDDEDEVLDASDKKKQTRRGRGKKTNVIIPVPEDEKTDAAQPDEIEVPATAAYVEDVVEGDTVEVEADAPAKKDKKKPRMGRSARRSSGKAEKA